MFSRPFGPSWTVWERVNLLNTDVLNVIWTTHCQCPAALHTKDDMKTSWWREGLLHGFVLVTIQCTTVKCSDESICSVAPFIMNASFFWFMIPIRWNKMSKKSSSLWQTSPCVTPQVAVFMYYGFQLDRLVLQVSSPSFLKSPLPYHPQLRAQAWRFLSYIFMHTGWVRVSSLNF